MNPAGQRRGERGEMGRLERLTRLLNRSGGLQQLPGGLGSSDGGFAAFLAAWKAIET